MIHGLKDKFTSVKFQKISLLTTHRRDWKFQEGRGGGGGGGSSKGKHL